MIGHISAQERSLDMLSWHDESHKSHASFPTYQDPRIHLKCMVVSKNISLLYVVYCFLFSPSNAYHFLVLFIFRNFNPWSHLKTIKFKYMFSYFDLAGGFQNSEIEHIGICSRRIRVLGPKYSIQASRPNNIGKRTCEHVSFNLFSLFFVFLWVLFFGGEI